MIRQVPVAGLVGRAATRGRVGVYIAAASSGATGGPGFRNGRNTGCWAVTGSAGFELMPPYIRESTGQFTRLLVDRDHRMNPPRRCHRQAALLQHPGTRQTWSTDTNPPSNTARWRLTACRLRERVRARLQTPKAGIHALNRAQKPRACVRTHTSSNKETRIQCIDALNACFSCLEGEWTTTTRASSTTGTDPRVSALTDVRFGSNDVTLMAASIQKAFPSRRPARSVLPEDFLVPPAIGVAEPGADPVRGQDS